MTEALSRLITDQDIRWAAQFLGLDDNAFHGEKGDDPRASVLKLMESADVAACPGSGKTTLLVAKLAILARSWANRSSGLCVLSHTNAARKEIEQRLGHTNVGRQLLSYPHFVGTIHSFLNEFLALPWLRSLGYPIHVIDTPITCLRVWKCIPHNLRYPLMQKRVSPDSITMRDVKFNPALIQKDFPFSASTNTYKAVRNALQATAEDGYFRHDDSLVWANSLLDRNPHLSEVVQTRFPLCFIDEAQDNSEAQARILQRLFEGDSMSSLVQRFGDTNQAIFSFTGQEGAETYRFPSPDRTIEVPNSHRFGPEIARLGDPLTVESYSTSLVGEGPQMAYPGSNLNHSHTLFLFSEETLSSVLKAYGDLLLDCFPPRVLKEGRFCAICQVHNEGENEKPERFPYRIGHYWPDYDAGLLAQSSAAQTFQQHIERGLAQARAIGQTAPIANAIARGIYQLASTVNSTLRSGSRTHIYRAVRERVAATSPSSEKLDQVIKRFAVSDKTMDPVSWKKKWRAEVEEIATILSGQPLDSQIADSFLAWDTSKMGIEVGNPINVFRHPEEAPAVEIELRTVHAVKGQTHTSTLVLESFWYKHNLESILPWLTGSTRHWTNDNPIRDRTRLHLHYVAMTRPSHLLCLAMKRDSFENSEGELDQEKLEALESVGWNVSEI